MSGTSRNHPRRRRLLAPLAVLVVVLVAGGLYWFQPWRLWTDTVVDDQLPVLAAEFVPPTASAPAAPRPAAPTVAPSAAPHPTVPMNSTSRQAAVPTSRKTVTSSATSVVPEAVLLAAGMLISHEHETSGTAELIRLADGHRALALKNLRTSDGPALHVWLTNAPVVEGSAGWHLFDDDRYLDLGDLKGNIGNQLYPIPDDVDLQSYSSVTIWCERFSVSFGAAALAAP